MIALLNQIPSEAKIKQQLRQIIFGKNLHCPSCRAEKYIHRKIVIVAGNVASLLVS